MQMLWWSICTSNFWGSCSIGCGRFSITQIFSLMKCCWCLLTKKCIFSQREDEIMHFVFYITNLNFIYNKCNTHTHTHIYMWVCVCIHIKWLIDLLLAWPHNIYLFEFIIEPNRICSFCSNFDGKLLMNNPYIH